MKIEIELENKVEEMSSKEYDEGNVFTIYNEENCFFVVETKHTQELCAITSTLKKARAIAQRNVKEYEAYVKDVEECARSEHEEVKACDERKSRGGRADTNPRSRQGLQVAYEMRLRLS